MHVAFPSFPHDAWSVCCDAAAGDASCDEFSSIPGMLCVEDLIMYYNNTSWQGEVLS